MPNVTAKYRKKPVEVEATQWTGDNEAELLAFTDDRFTIPQDGTPELPSPDITGWVYDVLHHTWVGVKTGQWVIKGVRGEFYPCDEDVFTETYDPA